MTAGAYGFVLSSNYNSRPRVLEIMVSGNKHSTIRKRETIDSLYENGVYLKMILTNNQKYLRSIAHDLKPFVMVGQNGLSDSVLAEIDSTLQKHELIKIKLRVDDRDVKQNIIERIMEFSHSQLVQVIGGVLVIYRPFDDNPDIILPRS